MTTALSAMVRAIEHELVTHNIATPPDAWLLGAARHQLVDDLLRGFLGNLAVLDWRAFRQLLPVLRPYGLPGLEATIGLSLPSTVASGATAEVIDNLARRRPISAPSLLFARLTRSTAGHVIFRSQLVDLAEGEFATSPLEAADLLARHTPSALHAIFVGRLIRTRPDLDSAERRALIDHSTRHLHRLLDDGAVRHAVVLLLRLAYYRVRHEAIAHPQMQQLRIVDFRSGGMSRRHSAPGA